MKKDYKSTRKSILASMILVPFIPLVFVVSTGYYYFTSSIETNTILNMSRIVEDHSQMIEEFLKERKCDLNLIANLNDFDEFIRTGSTRQVFEYLQESSNAFVDLGIFNGEGLQVAYYGPYQLSGKEYGATEWFNQSVKKGFFISDVFLGYRNIPHFIIAVTKKEGIKTWVIRATIDTQMFNNLVKKVRIGRTGEAYILNKKGLFQTERRSGGNLMAPDPDYVDKFDFHEGIKNFFHEDKSGVEYLYSTIWLKNGEWLLVVRQQKEDAFRTLYSATNIILIICLIGGAIITGLAFYVTNKIVKRLKQKDREKDKLNDQLIRAGRLAELGEMSAGFAHEINNPLQIIKNENTLIMDVLTEMASGKEIKENDNFNELKDSLKQIYIQIERCAEITQSILKFGRKSDLDVKDVHIGLVLRDVMNMVRKKADINGITVTLDIDRAPKSIISDTGQLQQIFLNLINNAIDAIIEQHGVKGGFLDIGIYQDNGSAEIRIKDNGCGISPDNLKKIFRPFFTTKPVGKGTGLGLSVCYGIVQNMGGILKVESVLGKGSTFTIRLPARDEGLNKDI